MAARVAGRRVTRLRALGAVLVVLVVLAVGGTATTVQYNQLNGPEQAVLDYAGLLADGRATEAARRVPLPEDTSKYQVDPALLTDAVMARASSRMRPLSASVVSGRAGGEGVPVGGFVTVDLTYGLGRQSAVATLRVQREPDGFPFAHRWRVTTPLLVPVTVASTLPSLGPPSIGGVVLPLTPATTDGSAPQVRPTLLYPGIYPLTTPVLALLTTDTDMMGTRAAVVAIQPSNALLADTVTTTLTWSPSRQMLTQLTSAVIAKLTECVAAGAGMTAGECPAALFALRNRPGLVSSVVPAQPVLGSPVLGGDGILRLAFGFSSPGVVRWTGGPSTGAKVPVSGVVGFGPTDDVIGAPVLATS